MRVETAASRDAICHGCEPWPVFEKKPLGKNMEQGCRDGIADMDGHL